MSDEEEREQPPVSLPSADAAAAPRAESRVKRAAGGAATEVEGTEGGKPVVVEFADEKDPPKPIQTPEGKLTLPPTTTEQEDKVIEGQRHISLLWESVQGTISVGITAAVIYCQLNDIRSETLNNAFFFVVATYLQRTNHVRIGGIGPKANEPPYRGR